MKDWVLALALFLAAGGLVAVFFLARFLQQLSALVAKLAVRVKALEREPFVPRPTIPATSPADTGVEVSGDKDVVESWVEEMEAMGKRVTPEEISLQREMRMEEGY